MWMIFILQLTQWLLWHTAAHYWKGLRNVSFTQWLHFAGSMLLLNIALNIDVKYSLSIQPCITPQHCSIRLKYNVWLDWIGLGGRPDSIIDCSKIWMSSLSVSAVCWIEVLLYESTRYKSVSCPVKRRTVASLSESVRTSHVIRWTVNQTRIWPTGQKLSDLLYSFDPPLLLLRTLGWISAVIEEDQKCSEGLCFHERFLLLA